jgi:hypothetical protein
MESTGLPNRVQVSEQTQRTLAPEFELEERCEVEVKGKGRLTVWLLLRRKLSAAGILPNAEAPFNSAGCPD